MVSFELDNNYKYNVLVGRPVGLQKVYKTNSKMHVLLLKVISFFTRETVVVYERGVTYKCSKRRKRGN